MFLQLIAVLKEKLECGPCADVIVQLDDPALLAANEGEIDPVKLQTFLKGTIKEWTIMADKFNCRYYQYTIEYDDDQLAEGVTGIDECQVEKICCADCLIDYVDEQFIDSSTIASLIENGDNTFTFDNGLGDTTILNYAHTLSAGPTQNIVRLFRPNGTFDDVTVLNAVSTVAPILGTGTLADPINFLISSDAGNTATLGMDNGLFVPTGAGAGETITTLVNNGNNSFTYTSENTTVTTVPFGHTLQAGATGVIRLNRPDLTFDNVNVTVNTSLPLFNTGAPGNPLGVLLSVNAGNSIVLGTDSGLFVPAAAPSPASILVTKGAIESSNGGSGNLFDVRTQSMGPAGTTSSTYLFRVPSNWDTAQGPTIRARLTNSAAAGGSIRFEWGVRFFALLELLDNIDDQTIGFTHVAATASNVLYQPAAQVLNPALIAQGDYMVLIFRRIGGDPVDTQSGNVEVHQVSVEFPRLAGNFGVTT